MMSLEQALLSGLVDYAGLFPPAGLPMDEAVANYADYQRRPDSYALGRLVVPVARLEEFQAAWAGLPSGARQETRWPLTVLAGNDLLLDHAVVEAYNRSPTLPGSRVESLELRLSAAGDAELARPLVEAGLEVYCELPLTADLPALASAVKRAGARAKVRTGGIKVGDIPAAEAVLAFLAVCGAERLAFKATAGLHHPVRGPAPLTYEPGSACATMFGYLNVVLAAAVIWGRRPEAHALALLTAGPGDQLQVATDSVTWAGLRVGLDEIARARREFMRSIGSCSFTEPLEEIRGVGFDPVAAAAPVTVTRSRT